MDEERYWPVVADFFVTVLAVFVFLYASVDRPDPELKTLLAAVRQELNEGQSRKRIQHFEVDERRIRIVYSAGSLGFDPCEWELPETSVLALTDDLRTLEPLAAYVSLLQIEGHADLEPATNCKGLKFKSNFELSQNRAMAVFAALHSSGIDDLDEIVRETRLQTGNSASFLQRITAAGKVLVAGFGATQPFDSAIPIDDPRHRRVELRVTLQRDKTRHSGGPAERETTQVR